MSEYQREEILYICDLKARAKRIYYYNTVNVNGESPTREV